MKELSKQTFVVSTSLQALNAIEMIHLLSLNDCTLILIKKQNRIEFDTLISFFPVGTNVYEFDFSRSRFIKVQNLLRFHFFLFKCKLLGHKPIDLFLGNYYEVLQNMVARVLYPTSSLFFIEDGVHTFKLVKRVNRQYFKENYSLKKQIRLLLTMGFRPLELTSKPIIFTTYNLQFEGLKVIRNRYRFFESLNQEKSISEDVLILGTVWYKTDLIDLYKKTIAAIWNENLGFGLKFLPHPSEDIMHLKDFLSDQGCKIVENQGGVEFYLLSVNSLPKRVYAFGSSAMFIIKRIFPAIEVYNVPLHTIEGEWRTNLKEVGVVERRDLL